MENFSPLCIQSNTLLQCQIPFIAQKFHQRTPKSITSANSLAIPATPEAVKPEVEFLQGLSKIILEHSQCGEVKLWTVKDARCFRYRMFNLNEKNIHVGTIRGIQNENGITMPDSDNSINLIPPGWQFLAKSSHPLREQ